MATTNESNQTDAATDELKQESQEDTQQTKAVEIVKPGSVRKLKLYLVDGDRFVVEWWPPKRLGSPLPIHYDLVVNDHKFESVAQQHDAKQTKQSFRVLVYNCELDEVHKVGIDARNEQVAGGKSAFQSIKTIVKPSVVTDLSMTDGVISWRPPVYQSFGGLHYELIDANDVTETTLFSTTECSINIHALPQYSDGDGLGELQWRVRMKESRFNNECFSPIIDYNIGAISCSRFTAATVYADGDDALTALPSIKYPRWELPPPPAILSEIENIPLVDKGAYFQVPTALDTSRADVASVLCFSDTHTKQLSLRFDQYPPADIILHGGDFTMSGDRDEVLQFEQWGQFIASLSRNEASNVALYAKYYESGEVGDDYKQPPIAERKYKHLICIAGNHEMTFDVDWYNKQGSNAKRYHKLHKPPLDAQAIKDTIVKSDHWQYLEDSSATVFGLKIHGSPYQPFFYNWAFQLGRGEELEKKWKSLPHDMDILLTHGPPFCHGDKVAVDRVKRSGDDGQYFGDEALMNQVQKIGSIQFHVFGHIHAGYGCSKQNGIMTTFVNAASLNEAYFPDRKPILFFIEKK